MFYSEMNKQVGQLALASLLALLISGWRSESDAQDTPANQQPAAEKQVPLGKFVTIFSPIDDTQFGRVKNVALTLRNEALKQGRRAVLVLEITPGSSDFHQVYGLADFLASAELLKVTTVAWIPKTVIGHNAILALACNEIIMHPDAVLGDVGRGEPLDKDKQQSVLSIVRKVHNLQVSPALAQGMMDPELSVLKLELGPAPDQITETRVVTQREAQRLRDNKEPILNDEVIWEPGITGKLTGSRARRLDVLIVKIAETRLEIAETYNLPNEAMREDPTLGEAPNARLIRVDGMIEPILQAFIIRQIDRAIASGANLLIFEIDSPGGFVHSGFAIANHIADLDPKKIRTVAYIPSGAISAASFIALGCREIYMRPDAKIGDAGVIQETGADGKFEFVAEKVLSDARVDLRIVADKTGKPSALAEAMADKDLLVFQVTHKETGRIWYMSEGDFEQKKDEWIKGPVVPESRANNFLIVNGRRAHELKIAGPPVNDLDDLKSRLGIPANVRLVALGRNWVDTLVFVLNHPVATFFLLVVGVACIYLELHLTTGLLGIMSAVCFGLFFWSKVLGGTAGWLEVVLFALGLGCVALEIFVIPGFGVFGVSGALLIFASMIMASQTFGNLDPGGDMRQMATTMLTLGGAVATVIGMAMVMNRYLPQIPLLNQIVLHPPGMSPADELDEPQLRPDRAGEGEAFGSLVGQIGGAFSDLRPAGKAMIGGQYLDVVSDGPYIKQGQRIEVIEVAGNRIVVKQV
jgi:membrane-bound serine protease (ClpP class)